MRAQDVAGRRFAVTKWREGYDMEQVDALLERGASTLADLQRGRDGAGHLTSEGVRSSRFSPTKLRQGYDQDEVDDFLDELAAELDSALASGAPVGRGPTLFEAEAARRDGSVTGARSVAAARTAWRRRPPVLLVAQAAAAIVFVIGLALSVVDYALGPVDPLLLMAVGGVGGLLVQLRTFAWENSQRPTPPDPS